MSSVEFSCRNYSVFANDRQIKSEIVILLFLVGFFENFSFLKKIKKIANLLDIFFQNLYIINHFAAVAQLVEQWTENPCVVGPIPTGGKRGCPKRNGQPYYFKFTREFQSAKI